MQVIFDADQAHQFSGFLLNTADGIGNARKKLSGEFRELNECWQDEKYKRFSQIFEETMQYIETFQKDAEDYLEYLWRKEKAIREYHENRY